MSLPIAEALPRVVDSLLQSGLKNRIRVVAAGKLVTGARAAWALCAGADFVNTARGFMFSLGCIQAMRCHTNTCPTGITTHNRRLQRGLVVEEKYLRVANYAKNMNSEIDMISYSCGLHHARQLGASMYVSWRQQAKAWRSTSCILILNCPNVESGKGQGLLVV